MKSFRGIYFLAYFLVGVVCYGGYGVSWDEPVSRLNGIVNLNYLAERFDVPIYDPEVAAAPKLHDWKDKDYGVAFELPLAAAEKLIGFSDSSEIYHFRHFVNFSVYFISVICLYVIIARHFNNEIFSLVCVLLYTLSPRFFAESFYNSKDIIFLALLIINHCFFVIFLQLKMWGKLFALSLVTSLMINVRIIGIIFPLYYSLLILWEGKASGIKFAFSYVLFSAFGSVLFFPYLWADPIGNLFNVLDNMASFRWRGDVLFGGNYIKSFDLPWFYIPRWILITLPAALVGLFFVGLIDVVLKVIERQALTASFLRFEGFAVYATLAPLILIWVKNPVMYDGWRQFYFLMFPLFMLMVLGLAFMYKISLRYRWVKAAGLFIIAAHSIYYTSWIYKNHPHQNVYFNIIPGSNLTSEYELDYWGVGNFEAIKKVLSSHEKFITISAVSSMPLENALLKLNFEDRKRVSIVPVEDSPSYLITNYRQVRDRSDHQYMSGYDVFFRIEVDGSRVITVYKKI